MKDRDYIMMRLPILYSQKWEAQGKTQEQFAEAIKMIRPDSGINKTYVSKLINGKYVPRPYLLQAICEVLEVNMSEFTPKTHEDKYKYSSAYSDKVEAALEKRAAEDFKINLTFLQGLRNIVPNFDSKFPMYAPLHYYGINALAPDGRERNVYERRVSVEIAEPSGGKGVLQIERDGELISLTKYDLKFIRELQNRISKLVSVYFEDHKKALEKAETEVNVRYWELTKENNPEFEQDNTIWTECPLSNETLQEIDKSGIYTEKEEKRFNLPRNGTSFVPEQDKRTEV